MFVSHLRPSLIFLGKAGTLPVMVAVLLIFLRSLLIQHFVKLECLMLSCHLHPSLIFSGKAGSLPVMVAVYKFCILLNCSVCHCQSLTS